MCAKPDPAEYLRDVSRVMEVLREDTGQSNPAHDLAWIGSRLYYGLLENA